MTHDDKPQGAFPILEYLARRERGPVAYGTSARSLARIVIGSSNYDSHVLVITAAMCTKLTQPSLCRDFFCPENSAVLQETGLVGTLDRKLILTDRDLLPRQWLARTWQRVMNLRTWPDTNPICKLRRFMHPHYGWAVYRLPLWLDDYDPYK